MAMVYRTVPSFLATARKFGSLNKAQENLEGMMYEAGYISFEDVYSFFKRNDEGVISTFSIGNENHKCFFLFSYDALMCTFSSIDGYSYDKYKFELLQYDIPLDILLKYCGYGFYRGNAYVEFCIPESEFKKNSSKTLNREILIDELSKYRELSNLSNFENKRAYFTDFVTGKRNLYDTSELYDGNDFWSFQGIIEQLNQKGVISPAAIYEIYKMFTISSSEVYQNREYEVRELQKKLVKVLG